MSEPRVGKASAYILNLEVKKQVDTSKSFSSLMWFQWAVFAPSQQKKRCLPTVSSSHFPLGKKTNKQTKRKQNNDNNNNNKLESIHQQIGQQ